MGIRAPAASSESPPAAALPPSAARTRLLWASGAVLVAVLPIVWPRSERPSWVPVTSSRSGASAAAAPANADPSSTASDSIPAPAPRPTAIRLVEYLNPFCVHCRATHARLAHVLEEMAPPLDRHRLYVWTGGDPPLWAKVCACLLDADEKKERVFFRELMASDHADEDAIYAVAARAGLDVPAIQACVGGRSWVPTLDEIHAAVEAAHVEGLPTIEIGSRRLEGEQSEDELRDAVRAALAEIRAPAR